MIAHRYILRQILKPLIAVLFAVNGLLLIAQLLKVGEVTFTAGLTFGNLLKTMIYFLPGFMMITGPVTVLLGILMGFARMSEDGELVAFAACGFSPWKLAKVPAVIGVMTWALTFYVSAVVAPACAGILEENFASLAKKQVAASLKAGDFFEDIPRLVLFPAHKTKVPGVFDGFLLYDHRPGHVRHALVANKARIVADDNSDRIDLYLSNGQVHARDKNRGLYSVLDFQHAVVGIDIQKVVANRTRFLHPYEAMSFERLAQVVSEVGKNPEENRLRASNVLYRRFAFPASCLVFALLAIGIGLSGKLRTSKGSLIVTGAVIVAYYLLVRLMDVIVYSRAMSPAIASWIPNAAVFALAVLILVRRSRVL